MVSWLVIGILIVLGIIAIKMNHLRHRIIIILFILTALFIYSTMTIVQTQNELDITSTQGIAQAVEVYLGWIANGYDNVKVLTGKAIGLDWTSTNGTFSETEETTRRRPR